MPYSALWTDVGVPEGVPGVRSVPREPSDVPGVPDGVPGVPT